MTIVMFYLLSQIIMRGMHDILSEIYGDKMNLTKFRPLIFQHFSFRRIVGQFFVIVL